MLSILCSLPPSQHFSTDASPPSCISHTCEWQPRIFPDTNQGRNTLIATLSDLGEQICESQRSCDMTDYQTAPNHAASYQWKQQHTLACRRAGGVHDCDRLGSRLIQFIISSETTRKSSLYHQHRRVAGAAVGLHSSFGNPRHTVFLQKRCDYGHKENKTTAETKSFFSEIIRNKIYNILHEWNIDPWIQPLIIKVLFKQEFHKRAAQDSQGYC